jgi:hypothetical protein
MTAAAHRALVAALLLAAVPAHAQTAPPASPRVLSAAPALGAMRVDGRLDERAWAAAAPATDFVQTVPTSGAPASERSEVRVLYDRNALYIGYRLYDSRPDSIAAQLARRDASGIYTDWAHVAIDSYHDRRTAWRFSLNPRGVQADGAIFNDTERDALWDAVWEGAASIDSLGWVAEFRIPLSQLRYATGADGAMRVWGINFARELARRGERAYWSETPPDAPGIVSRMGTLVGLDSLVAPSRLELIPYARAQVTRAPGNAADPFHDPTDGGIAAGLDLRYRLPRNLTLSASVNPDFGQVEADPAVVNLSAFEVFFPERRPFFLEGQDVFRFGGTRTFNDDDRPTFFYTRRLGRAPQRRLAGADVAWVDAPAQTPILAAAKVSGKTPGGWSVGALGAATRRQTARVASPTGARGRSPVEPGTGYGVVRLRRDLRGGNTVVGGIATAVARDVGDPAFSPLLPERAVAGGMDFEHAWGDRTWALSGVVAGTRVAGDPRALVRLQRAAYRLYQRPDAGHVVLDTTRGALAGRFSALSVAKTGGRHWLGSTTFEETTPGFETNDLGFQQRSDRRTWSNALTYRENRLGTRGLARLFREYSVSGYYTYARNLDGDVVASRPALGASGTFRSFWSASTMLSLSDAADDDRLTRGGPVVRVPGQWSVDADVSTDSRRAAVLSLAGSVGGNAAGEWARSAALELDARPSSALRVRFAPGYERRFDTDQYVTAAADPLATATFGRRYVFADLAREELAADVRVDWTFTPRVSLELFARPFVSRGRYVALKELAQPSAFGFAVYGRDVGTVARADGRVRLDPDGTGAAPAIDLAEPDFAVRSLRGNAVARWEFRPGSTLFVVWQQQREGAPALDGRRGSLGRDAVRAFGDRGTDVLLLKVSRWFGR